MVPGPGTVGGGWRGAATYSIIQARSLTDYGGTWLRLGNRRLRLQANLKNDLD